MRRSGTTDRTVSDTDYGVLPGRNDGLGNILDSYVLGAHPTSRLHYFSRVRLVGRREDGPFLIISCRTVRYVRQRILQLWSC